MAEREKTSLEILYPGKEIYGYKIRPWGLRHLAELSPILEELKIKFKDKSLDFNKIFNLNGDIKNLTKKEIEKKTKEYQNNMIEGLFDIGLSIFPYAAKIISITTDMKIKDANELTLDKAMIFLLTIVEQNLSFLKNSFGLVINTIENLMMTE